MAFNENQTFVATSKSTVAMRQTREGSRGSQWGTLGMQELPAWISSFKAGISLIMFYQCFHWFFSDNDTAESAVMKQFTAGPHLGSIEKEPSCFHGNVPSVVETNGVVVERNGVVAFSKRAPLGCSQTSPKWSWRLQCFEISFGSCARTLSFETHSKIKIHQLLPFLLP